MTLRRLAFRIPLALAMALLAIIEPGGIEAQLVPLPQDLGAMGLGLALRRLPVAGSVLYVTAHPDDENNGVLVALGRGRGLDVTLLSLTRGDGGQNEIGPELFEALGVLRTEELAAVHRFDGARQLFSLAYEFGYSYSVEETFAKWGREETLRDVVRVVRAVRPDVILTLSLEGSGGGQHHQAAARLAVEAFRAAADPARFSEQLAEGLRPWQAAKVYQGGVGGGGLDRGNVPTVVDTSAYDPLLGMSWHQYGMLARAMHKCQGMVQLRAPPGQGRGVYALVDAEPKAEGGERDLFDGIDTSLVGLARFASGRERSVLGESLEAITASALEARAAYERHQRARVTEAVRAGLASLRALSDRIAKSGIDEAGRHELTSRLRRKEADFESALTLAHDLAFEALADDGDVVPGQTFTVKVRLWNQGSDPVRVEDVGVRVPEGWTAVRRGEVPPDLSPGRGAEVPFAVTVAEKARHSQPYWRRNPKVDRYDLDVPEHQTLPWSPPEVQAVARYSSGAVPASVQRPAWWRYEGRWVGEEKQKWVNVVPSVSVAVTPRVAIVPAGATGPRELRVEVRSAAREPLEARVRLEVPSGWSVTPREVPLRLRYEGEGAITRFFVSPPVGLRPGDFQAEAIARVGDREYRQGYQVIAYHHVHERHLFHPATSRVRALDVRTRPRVSVGYVAGAGDEVPVAIAQLGIPVTLLEAEDLAWGDLSRFATIVTGIRSYQTRPDLRAHNERLLDFARAGGHVVVQYNKFEFNRLAEGSAGATRADSTSPFAPYPAAVTANRITDETAPVRILVPAHPFFRSPNAISARDFEGWVQERGLYFLDARDERYVELLASADPFPFNAGEKKGLLVEARVGRGTWTYVGLGLWRQLPAGTPGAYRLLANILSRSRGGSPAP